MNVFDKIVNLLKQHNVPQNIDKTFEQILERHQKKTPDSIALLSPVFSDISYRQLYESVLALRAELNRAGVRNKSRVALLIENPTEFFIAALAITGNAICIPLPHSLTPEEISRDIVATEAEFLVIKKENTPVKKLRDSLSGKTIPIVTSLKPSLRLSLYEEANFSSDIVLSQPCDTAYILQTTGSTALPKLVPITHQAIVTSCLGCIESLELKTSDRCLNFMPLNHIHGLVSCTYMPLVAGSSSMLAGQFHKHSFFEWMKIGKPTWLSTTPSIYKDIIKTASENPTPSQFTFRFIRIGSAPMTTQFGKQLEKYFGVPLIEAYGMTETMQLTGNPISKRKVGSVGKSIGAEVVIFSESGQVCQAFEKGFVMVRGKSIMKGYLNNPDANLESFQGDWFKTGDLGWLDNEGYLFLSGRAKEMINRGGEKIAPAEIEQAILSFESIEEAVAFPIIHPLLGEDIGVAISIKANCEFEEETLRTFLLTKLSAHKIPGKIRIVQEFPRTPNGKIVRKQVQELFSLPEHNAPAENRVNEKLTQEQHYVRNWFIKILKDDTVTSTTDFFSAGGTSLDAAALIAGISQDMNETIHGITFMRNPTVAGYTRFLIDHYPDQLSKITGVSISSTITLKKNIDESDLVEFRKSLSIYHHSNSINKTDASPVFILSSSRAGSTLLRAMLAGNSNLFAPPELRLLNFDTLSDWKNTLSGEFTFYQEGLVRAVMQAFQLSSDEALSWIDSKARNGVSTIDIYTEFQRAIGSKIMVDKTPYYSLKPESLDRMETGFNQPKYLYLLRNPVDMKHSYEKAHLEQLWMQDHRYTSGQLAELIWNECYSNIETFLSEIPEERKVKLYFEDLVTFPEQVMKNICAFLSVPFEEEMLHPQHNPSEKMTDSPFSGSTMIGDPHFFKHKGVNASSATSGFYIPADTDAISKYTAKKAYELGYNDEKTQTNSLFPQSFIEQQKKLTKSWSGKRKSAESLVMGLNTSGTKTPLFWCFQAADEFAALATALGEDQPLYGMRSGHLLFKRDPVLYKGLAKLYVNELIEILPDGPYIIGGNCQGAQIMWHVANELNSLNREVPVLCLMEVNIKEHYPGNIALFYGAESNEHNPYLYEPDPDSAWKKHYASYSVNILSGAHGQFFRPENISGLASKIKTSIEKK